MMKNSGRWYSPNSGATMRLALSGPNRACSAIGHVPAPGGLFPEVAEQRQDDDAEDELGRDGRDVVRDRDDRRGALHDDGRDEKRERRTEERDEIPLRADANVADLLRRAIGRVPARRSWSRRTG